MGYRLYLAPEGLASGDGRAFELDSLEWRTGPLPLMWTPQQGVDHEGAMVVGAFSSISRQSRDGVPWIVAESVVWDSSPMAQEALRMVDDDMMRGVSVDVDPDTIRVELNGRDDATDWIERGEIRGATIVPIPAFPGAEVVVTDESTVIVDEVEVAVGGDELDAMLAAAQAEVEGDDPVEWSLTINNPKVAALADEVEAAEQIVAHSLGADVEYPTPPASWFNMPEPDEDDERVVWVDDSGAVVAAGSEGGRPWGVPLTITTDGRVFGHLASWSDCHTGYEDRCVTPPRSQSGYVWFHTGATKTTEGDIPTGRITVGTGHADRHLSAASAIAHYDNTGHAVADVRASDGKFGPWLAGWVRPWATRQQRHELAASPPSGDWRPRGGHPELLGVLAVNQPGFPLPRTVATFRGADATELVSLVASGLPPVWEGPSDADALAARIDRLEAQLEAERLLREFT